MYNTILNEILEEKHVLEFSRNKGNLFWIFDFFEILEKNQVFLIPSSYLTLYVYNSILDKKVGKTQEEPTNNFKMIPNFLRFFFEILRVCLARHTNIDELKTKEKA